MATKKKQITETTKPVELPKETPVAEERVKAVRGSGAIRPTYASTQYLSDSFECTRCYQLATRRFGKTPVWQDPPSYGSVCHLHRLVRGYTGYSVRGNKVRPGSRDAL